MDGIWIDYGRDNYAGVTWSNIPSEDGRKLFIGWMSNWHYATSVPTKSWRSAMTVARELRLEKQNDSYRLFSYPVEELDNYLETIRNSNDEKSGNIFKLFENEDGITQHQIELKLTNLVEDVYTFTLANDNNEKLLFGLDRKNGKFFLDRRNSGQVDFEEKFADRVSFAPMEEKVSELKVLVLIDEMSIEIFYNNGQTVFTEIFFPNTNYTKLNLSSNSEFKIHDLVVKEFQY